MHGMIVYIIALSCNWHRSYINAARVVYKVAAEKWK